MVLEYDPAAPADPRTTLDAPFEELNGIDFYEDVIFEIVYPRNVNYHLDEVKYMIHNYRYVPGTDIVLVVGMMVFKRRLTAARIWGFFPPTAHVSLYALSGTRVEHAASIEDRALTTTGVHAAYEYFAQGTLKDMEHGLNPAWI